MAFYGKKHGCFIHVPKVEVIRLDGIDDFLRDLGYNPDPVTIPNRGSKLPEIREEVFQIIFLAEKDMYYKYGYGVFPDENENKKWRSK